MNKPIRLTQEIANPNNLLNKFIFFKYKNKYSLSLYYIYNIVYNIGGTITIFTYNIFYNKGKIVYSELYNLNLSLINTHINESLDKYCLYKIYIIQ